MDASLEVFRRLGATVTDIDLPDLSAWTAAGAVVHAAEANPFHDEWFRTRRRIIRRKCASGSRRGDRCSRSTT